ncbi:MAG: hypothetical protein P4L52_02710 [Acidocella sp.]|nr:hypothetical protein [Acidocella sp.]
MTAQEDFAMADAITISLKGSVSPRRHYAAHLIVDALRAAGATVKVGGVLTRRALVETELDDTTVWLHLDEEGAPAAAQAPGSSTLLMPMLRILGTALLVLVVGSAEIRLHFPPTIDLLLLGGSVWWFWQKTARSKPNPPT